MMERSRSKSDIFGILQKDIRSVGTRLDRLISADRSLPDWIALTLAGAWLNFGGGEATAAYWRNSSGMVLAKGVVKSGTVPSVVATFPIGFRPLFLKRFPLVSNGLFGYATVSSVGDLTVVSGSNVYVDLSPIVFRAEQ